MFYPTLTRFANYIAALMIVLLPFHAFLSVWAANVIGNYTAVRLWKEVLLGLLFAAALILVSNRRDDLWKMLRRQPVFMLIIIYGIVLVISGILAILHDNVSPLAFAYGLLLNGRFLLFFLVALVFTMSRNLLAKYWRPILLAPAAVVILIALLQYFVLPPDVLKHFGYGPETIPAVSTIDNKLEYQRIQSTLRGANPLGAYLVIIISAVAAMIMRSRKLVWWQLALQVTSFIALVVTFSRSAWIGTLAAVALLAWIAVGGRATKKILLLAGVVFLVAFAATGYALRDNDTFQNAFFHTDENSTSAISSNTGRMAALQSGLHDIVAEPLGRGTGTAGPASVYNSGHAVRLSENYFLQVGQEVGVLGLGIFLAINVLVARTLWRWRSSRLALALFVSFIGLTLVNMLSHAWADDTLAYVWWGLAGAAFGAGLKRTDGNDEAAGQ